LVPEIRYYVASDGGSPFEVWFSNLDIAARAKMTVAIARMEQAICRGRSQSAKASLSTRLISDRDTGSISDVTVTR